MAWFKSGYKQTDTKDRTASFTQAGTRENIRSGEKHKTIFGKIYRWFADLKPVAFTGSYNDLSDKPSNFAPSGHTHSRAQITDFPSSMPASDVYAWAKSSSKPAYTAAEVGALPISGGAITGGLSVSSDISTNGAVGVGGAFIIAKGYYSGNYHVANFWDGVNEAGIGFTSNTKGECILHPHADGAGSLGAFFRWKDIYAVNGAISTSDRNEKKEISYIGSKSSYEDTSMTDEKLIQLIMGLHPVIFKRINGESGRPHHGIIAQDFEELMTEIGLHDHAAFIKSPVTKIKEVETKDEDGNTKQQLVEETVPGEYRYGIRYEEFISDLIRFCQLLKDENNRQQKKIEDLEKRMEILENAVKCS